ncbi:hypothetical protein WA026_009853 [Henosepilachna vigintioctopunctata]|uniref:G-protein coupled receptors family 1 profile domain-containing protein n=1 Tax=Henosepilachna vigintioctopunctata TaxID=420089 RepID=A0AAW1TJ49_9CUCU
MNYSGNYSGDDSCGPTYGYYINLLHSYYLPLISLFGIVGNCLSFTVFMSPYLKMRSSSYYLAALAVADLGFLIVVTIVQCSFVGILELYNTDGWCQFFVYISSVCATLSVWLIVAFTVERFIAVKYPLKRPNICTVRRARIVISTLLFLALTTQIYVLWVAGVIKIDDDGDQCAMLPEYNEFMKIVNFVDTIFTLIIPLVLIVLMNTMIVRGLITFRRKMLEKELHGRYPEEIDNRIGVDTVESQSESLQKSSKHSFLFRDKRLRSVHLSLSEQHSQIHIRNSETSVATRHQNSITKMLLTISSVFVALNLPSYLIRIWICISHTLFEKTIPDILWCTQQVAILLYYTNFSVNFILYTMCGGTFRRCLWKLIKKIWKYGFR